MLKHQNNDNDGRLHPPRTWNRNLNSRALTNYLILGKILNMSKERKLQISPIAADSVIHNTKVLFSHTLHRSLVQANTIYQILTNIHNLTASLFGIGAGILGLESYPGFLFYIVFTLFTTVLIYALRITPTSSSQYGVDGKGTGKSLSDTSAYFQSALSFWMSGIVDGASGFVLTWTLFYGLVRAWTWERVWKKM